jgi:hypothetical protein
MNEGLANMMNSINKNENSATMKDKRGREITSGAFS